MAFVVKKWYTIFAILVILNLKTHAQSEPQVPCYFIFGDSLFDNGNNNLLLTTAKANYPPYGIDFPGGPTGRFTNGRNMADIIAELLGFDSHIPPFATAKGWEILRGVNYASGGAGIRDETGRQLGDVISLNRQLLNHRITILRMTLLLGSKKAAEEHLSKCLYNVGMGNNDYINNYLLPKYYPSSLLYSPDKYATLLAQQYSQQLKDLYKLGARKIAIFGVGLIGCLPAEVERINGSLVCVDSINNAVQLFNDRLRPLVDEFNNNFPDAKFIIINMTSISSGDPSTLLGVRDFNSACCNVSTTIAKGQCSPGTFPCVNRNDHIFFDNFHPTELINQLFASRAYTALLPTDAYPFEIRRLVNSTRI